ncbi:MAG: DMT family transporter [Bryobacteraceae bacterium]
MRYFAILILVNLMWAFQFSGAKIAAAQLGPVAVAFLPMAIATLLLSPLLLIGHPPASRSHFWYWTGQFFLLALFGPVPAQLALVWGVERSLASNAAVINLSIPVVTAVMAAILVQEKMTRLRWISFALAIAGVLAVSHGDLGSAQLFDGKYLAGNALIFVSCCGSAFNNTYSKKLLRTFRPIDVLVYGFAASDIILLPLMLVLEPDAALRLASLARPAWLSLGLIAVFSLSLSMLLFLWVIDRIDVTRASLSIYLLPVFGVILSSVTLHETISPSLAAGGALVFVSTFLVTFHEESNRRAAVRKCNA